MRRKPHQTLLFFFFFFFYYYFDEFTFCFDISFDFFKISTFILNDSISYLFPFFFFFKNNDKFNTNNDI